MAKQVEIEGVQLISVDDVVLAASKSQSGAWYELRRSEGFACQCLGYQHRGRCRHHDALTTWMEAARQPTVLITPDRDTAPLAVGPGTDPSGLFYAEALRAAIDTAGLTFEALFGEAS